jgi:phosphoglycerate-specific signal transduction histidine kinase
MAFNYLIAYDLNCPGQNYDAVIERIKSLGKHAHMQLSLFYLQSDLTLAQVHASIREVMDVNDKLAVIWAKDAFVSNYDQTHLATLRREFTATAALIAA